MKAPNGFIMKAEAANTLGCKVRTIDNMMRKKMIPFYKVGRRVLFKSDELLKTIADYKVDKVMKNGSPVSVPITPDVTHLWDSVLTGLQRIERLHPDYKHRNLAKACLNCINKFEV